MRTGFLIIVLMAFTSRAGALQQTTPKAAQAAPAENTQPEKSESEHKPGPEGLEGWTLQGPIPDHPKETYSFTLVIARDGNVIQHFDGDPLVWKWMFLKDGKRVAYESGPLHFSLTCILADIKSGRKRGSYDCYHDLPANAPDWVRALEALP